MTYIEELGKRAKEAAGELGRLGIEEKNAALIKVAEQLIMNEAILIEANKADVELAEKRGTKESLIDRLRLTSRRIADMADGLKQIAELKDPVGELTDMVQRPNGLKILKKRVPVGVIGIIYEARPNVTVDAFGLCFKTGNSVILRGGSDAINSNIAIGRVIRDALREQHITEDAVCIIANTEREHALEMMKLNKYIDVLIPRGGAGLIKTVVQNSTVPVIETGTGNCHIYVDEYADIGMALEIIDNAKTQRLGVCNACESLVVHEGIAEKLVPPLYKLLSEKGIVFRADEECRRLCPSMEEATEEDFYTEYLDRMISVKLVSGIDEAVKHINEHNTGHSEAIITENYTNALKFLDEIDAAAVYVNASTRFTDGNEFGMGAEIGISTQKLHARGPMGLEALTTTKYIIFGNGQVRT